MKRWKTLARDLAAPAVALCVLPPSAALADGAWVEDQISGCAVWSAEPVQPGDGLSWSGSCADGKADGAGVLVWWDADGLKGRYAGELWNGRHHGEGAIRTRSSEGDGFDSFVGRFVDSRPVGTGYLVTTTGARMISEVLDGASHVRGIVVTPEGVLARGEFRDGKGVGPLIVDATNAEGDRYVGQAENGERHGYGVFTSAEGDRYAGRFQAGALSGAGVLEAADGSVFAGFFRDGAANGFGAWVSPDGAVVQGRFVDGEPVGEVLVTLPDLEPTLTSLAGESEQ